MSPITSALRNGGTTVVDKDTGEQVVLSSKSDGDQSQVQVDDMKAVTERLKKEREHDKQKCLAAESAIDEEEKCLSTMSHASLALERERDARDAK